MKAVALIQASSKREIFYACINIHMCYMLWIPAKDAAKVYVVLNFTKTYACQKSAAKLHVYLPSST
jgi:hypothetical protein